MALGLTPKQIIDKGTHPLLVKKDTWLRVELGDICIIQNGYAFSSKYFNHEKGLPLIRIRDILKKETENLYSGEYSEEYLVRKNDFLIGMDGDFKISKWPGELGLLNQRVCRIILQSNLMSKEYVFLCIQPYLDAIHSETSAVTVKHLSSKTISEIPIPLPPLPEQRAIVKKIEALFSSLDAGIADLKKAQDQLKIYRQAVLKKAFEGEGEYYNICDVTKEIFAGGDKPTRFSENKNSEFSVPIYANAVANKGLYGYTDIARVNQAAVTIAGRGSGTGHVELREHPYLPIVRLINVLPNEEILDAKYLFYYLKGQNITGTGSAIPQLTIPTVKEYLVFVPSLEEQAQIVKEIESRLSVCDAVEQQIKDSLSQAEALRQSILKKAFEGRLLSEAEIKACQQERDYDPASVLLEKIKDEKEANKSSKKTKKK